MTQNSRVGLLKAMTYLCKKRNSFSLLQAMYLFCEVVGARKKAKELRMRTLKAYIGLEEDGMHYILDDLLFFKTEESLTESIIGMCLDIFLKDEFYSLKDELLRKNVQDQLQFYFYQEGAYETKEVQVCENDIVIDAGANMGMFSILAAKKRAKVYAFEPQKVFFHLLNANCKLNALEKRIQAYTFAISSHEYKTSLSVNPDNLLSASINIDREGQFETVMCTSIDHWVKTNQIPRIDFIKADIEGAERLLLDGAKNTIKKFKPKLAIATYHLPDDREILRGKILDLCSDYKIIQTRKILFAYEA